MSVKYWHASTEEQVRAAFPDYRHADAGTLHTERYSLKTENMKTYVLQTAQPSRFLFQ
jgi:hypothetical protein